MTHVTTFFEVFDPRGRCNRKGFLILAFAMLGAQLAVIGAFLAMDEHSEGWAAGLANAFFFWLVTSSVSKRLHDIGLSGWWIVKAALIILAWATLFIAGLMFVLPNEAFEPGAIGFWLGVGGTTVPVFLAILWLHCAHGIAGDNIYGPEPKGLGFSRNA